MNFFYMKNISWSVPILKGVLCPLAGILLGAGGYAFFYGEGTSYLSDNPRAAPSSSVFSLELLHEGDEGVDGFQGNGVVKARADAADRSMTF